MDTLFFTGEKGEPRLSLRKAPFLMFPLRAKSCNFRRLLFGAFPSSGFLTMQGSFYRPGTGRNPRLGSYYLERPVPDIFFHAAGLRDSLSWQFMVPSFLRPSMESVCGTSRPYLS